MHVCWLSHWYVEANIVAHCQYLSDFTMRLLHLWCAGESQFVLWLVCNINYSTYMGKPTLLTIVKISLISQGDYYIMLSLSISFCSLLICAWVALYGCSIRKGIASFQKTVSDTNFSLHYGAAWYLSKQFRAIWRYSKTDFVKSFGGVTLRISN